MPAMTMTNKVYQALEQAVNMTGATKIPSWRMPSAVTLSNCRKMPPVLIRSGSEGLVFLRLLNRIASEQKTGSICKNLGLSRPPFCRFSHFSAI